MPGGLNCSYSFACAIFAAITGSSVACAVTISAIAIPEMLSRGYERTLVLGAVATGGTLGILIPPSIPMILCKRYTGESGQVSLFMSGVVPGVILTLLFIAVVVYNSKKICLCESGQLGGTFSGAKKFFLGTHCCRCLSLAVFIREAFALLRLAAIGTVYSLFITFVIYRTLGLKDMPKFCWIQSKRPR